MENKFEIKVFYSDELITSIGNDNPDFNAIADYFIKNKDADCKLIKVESSDECFDSAALEEAICDAVKEFLEKISNNEKNFKDFLEQYNLKKDKSN